MTEYSRRLDNTITGPIRQSSRGMTTIRPLDFLQGTVDNLRVFLLGSLGVGLLKRGYRFDIASTFTAAVKFVSPRQLQSGVAAMLARLALLSGLEDATSINNHADQLEAFLKGRSIKDALVDRMKMLERQDTRFRKDDRNVVGSSIAGASRSA